MKTDNNTPSKVSTKLATKFDGENYDRFDLSFLTGGNSNREAERKLQAVQDHLEQLQKTLSA